MLCLSVYSHTYRIIVSVYSMTFLCATFCFDLNLYWKTIILKIHWFYLESLRVAHIQFTTESYFLITYDGGARGNMIRTSAMMRMRHELKNTRTPKVFFFLLLVRVHLPDMSEVAPIHIFNRTLTPQPKKLNFSPNEPQKNGPCPTFFSGAWNPP